MNGQAQRYPLVWPMNWKRTPPDKRERATFRRTAKTTYARTVNGQNVTETRESARTLTISDAIDRLAAELRRLGARDEILSTNVTVNLKGLPYSVAKDPHDTGAAVYITLGRKPLVFACDKWDRVADNIAAIAQHIDALRRIERYGVGRLDQAFVGYAALPPAAGDWRIVLGVGDYATIEQVDAAFLEKMKAAHPDAGGTHDEAAKLTAARDFARRVLSEGT